MTLTMMTRNIFVILFIFLVCFKLSTCMDTQYTACSLFPGIKGARGSHVQCNRSENNTLTITCSQGIINITNVFYDNETRECNNNGIQCENCCRKLMDDIYRNHTVEKKVRTTCNNLTSCTFQPDVPDRSNRSDSSDEIDYSYTINYSCIPRPLITTTLQVTPELTSKSTRSTNTSLQPSVDSTSVSPPTRTTQPEYEPGNSSKQTGSDKFPTVAVAAPVAIVVISACVILVAICIVRRRRQNNDGIYSNKKNNNINVESVSYPAYTTEGSDNNVKPSKSVERTASSFSQDSGYAECKDVDTVDANTGEYHTINFTQSSPNIDPAYSHIQKQDKMVDNTYSHISSDLDDQNTASNYSHMDMKSRQPNKTGNSSTYNTLQPHAANKPQQRLPANDEESENEYNHANFSTGSSKEDDDDTEYSHLNSHLNSSNNGFTRTSPSQANPSPNGVEYAKVVNNNNNRDLNADNDHAYFVLEKDNVREAANVPCDSSDNNAHTYFVLEKDKGYTKNNAESEVESTPHEYFVLTKQ